MAKFTISPGVTIRESDQSQYAATNPGTANVAVLVGYAEKGPFEPTYVSSQQDFAYKFGKTLKDVPYLAQAAYKFFDEGQSLLVVRAGDDRDPSAYPNAATFASKTIRIAPEEISATIGSQTFRATANLLAGSFTPGADYTFKVVADQRAFQSTKYVETWTGKAAESYNGEGDPLPSTTILDGVLKIAGENSTSNSFECNFKQDTLDGDTVEFYGTGSRSGSTLGSTFTSTVRQYRNNDTYQDVDANYMTINGVYGAAVAGTANRFAGFDWENTPQNFKVTLGAVTYVVSLDTACTTIAEVVAEINTKLADAVIDGTSTPADISSKIEAIGLLTQVNTAYVALKHKTGPESGFTLAVGSPDALVTLGLAPGTYDDATALTGRYDSSIDSVSYSGDFVFTRTATTAAALSFQDAIDISIVAPANGGWTLSSIASAIQAKLDLAFSPTYNFPKSRAIAEIEMSSGKVKIKAAGAANETFASLVRITAGSGNSLISLLGGTDGAVDGDPTQSIGEAIVTLRAKEKGSYGNKLIFRTEIQTVRTGQTTLTYDNVYVLLDGKEVSAYPKVSWTDATSANYILTRMANDAFVAIEALDEDDNSTLAKLPVGDWTLGDEDLPNGVEAGDAEITAFALGTNGWTATNGVIMSMSADFVNAIDKVSNPEVFEFNLIAAPGDASSTVQNAIQDLCDSRRDCFGITDAAEFGLGLGIKDKTREITEVNAACSTLNSSYVGTFWPWIQDYDSDNAQYVWLPPSIYALKAMVYTDNVADPWWAPAGLRRGKVSALNVEYSPTNTDRDILYGDTAIVNPIVKFVNEGISIWGQKTAQRTKSATDRINVRRLLIYAEKLIAKMARGFLFEPNDSANWAAFARQANAILEPIRQRRGLYQFQVVCDESTNTSDLIDQNIMAGKIFLQPTKTIEFIQVDFTISASGELTVTEG